MRQCPTRYAIRAGQNLPDKEFRYLRTVIVTAAVYWRFKAPIHRFTASQRPVFLLNSRLGLLSATANTFSRKGLLTSTAPLIPKLRGQFAEFLKMDYLAAFSILNSSTSVGLRYGFSISH